MGDPSRVRVTGPLTAYATGFAAELERVGYTKNATADQVRVLAHLSRWLAARDLSVQEVTPVVCAAFLTARRHAGYTLWLSQKALAPLLAYLRGLDVVPPEPVVERTPAEALLERYRGYLTSERGLTASTAEGYVHLVRPFVKKRERSDGTLDLSTLAPGDITRYVLANVAGCGSAKLAITSLRSLLVFLHLEGLFSRSLVSAVPSVAGARLTGLPRALKPREVEQMLASCDRDTVIGRRDSAVLTVLARLGLRAGEVVALRLDDVDWRGGEIMVRGKGDRRERLPLPVDVGRAVAAYLRHGRPVAECRHLFLRFRAPHRALSSSAVTAIVMSAALRAGLPQPIGAHQLRHSAATAMLRAGAPLAEIGQVLRHRSPLSTAIYAKVDRTALREIARPWPG